MSRRCGSCHVRITKTYFILYALCQGCLLQPPQLPVQPSMAPGYSYYNRV
jgi:hypothetical protein